MTQTPQIQLIPIRINGVFSEWRMSVNGGPASGPGHYPHIPVPAKDNADFSFTIQNAQGISFSNDPIWIQKGTAKPTGGVDGQITQISGQGTAKLTFHDGNQDRGPLSYVLNFNGAPSLDPIIDNAGGGPGFTEPNLVWYAVGAVALLVVLVLILRPMFRSKGPVERQP